jgi:DNA invertase Pin-like site-specific DNA recombinase
MFLYRVKPSVQPHVNSYPFMKKRGPKKKHYIHKVAETTVKWTRPKDGQMMLGYVRVSTSDQTCQRQIDELVKYGVAPEDIFEDKQSGKTLVDRAAWQACFRDLQRGDLLVIYSLDRLGRNLGDLIEVEKQLFDKGVRLKVIQQDIDTTNASGRMIFHILGALAQWEREWNWERTKHGLDRARDRGIIGGQPAKHSDQQIKDALKATGSVSEAAKLLKCAKITIIRRQQMWAEGRKLQLPVGLGFGGIGHGRMHKKQTKNKREPINV